MAVQQNRKTPAKRGKRRAHDVLDAPALSIDPTSGETHRRHHISPDGSYRGRRIIAAKEEETE
jgi:large subunit ribosomal protein L32